VSRTSIALTLMLLSAALPRQSAAQAAAAPSQAAWRQDFEGPATSWSDAGGDATYTVVAHQRVRGGAHGGEGCEWMQTAVQAGSAVYFAHDVGRPSVIEELRPALWIFSDRAGLQFLAEVTLPRTRDPRTGKPLTTNIVGSTYTAPGRWQQLVIADFPRTLLRQVHLLRSQLSLNVDSREAFVSRVLLNVCGGPGTTNVWTDDLEVYGHVPSRGADGVSLAPPPAALAVSASGASSNMIAATGPAVTPPEPLRREVKLDLSVLTVNGYPIFPRAVEYRGERLAFLKQLGFNTIWLRTMPSREFLWEARQLGLWLVSPPPELPGDQTEGAFGPEYEPVLVWDLGHGLTGETLDTSRRRAERVRMADARFSRPLLCAPTNNLRNYSRQVEILLIDRQPLGTSLEMPDWGIWVRRQPLLALPGTPIWTTIQTQAGEGLRRQILALMPGQGPPTTMGYEQLRLLVYTAISSGSRGLLFLSDSSLEAQDDQTRQRVAAMQLLNLELAVVEPIVGGGSFDGLTTDPSQPQVSGAILRDDRARIVMPMWLAPGSQCVAPEAAANPLLLTLPGVPESSNIFELAGGRLKPLDHLRAPGGTQVTLKEFGLSSLLFLAQDPLIIDAVSGRAAATGPQMARLERYLAGQKLDTVLRVYGQIGGRVPQINSAMDVETARQELKVCDARLASGDYAMASAYARRAMRPLRKLERAAWDAAMKGRESSGVVPCPSFQALPWYWTLMDRAGVMRPGANRLSGGDFEDIPMMVQSGWRHFQHNAPGIQSAADLVPDACHGGRMGLRLTARADTPEHPPAMIEMPPLWITSPAMTVNAGQIVRIHGWVNVSSAITGSVDGLMVVESLTGEEMALRIDKTAGWREFSMLRIVPQTGPMALTFVLTGLGEARLDDVTVEVLESGFGAGTAR
jgi:hypothetical protein